MKTQIASEQKNPEAGLENEKCGRAGKFIWKKHGRTLIVVLFSSMAAVAFGSALGYMTPALPSIIETRSFPMTDSSKAVAVSFGALGALPGLISGQLSDKFGRKIIIIYASIPLVFGWLMIAAAPNIYCFSAGRLLTSFATRMIDSSLPVYIAEISAAEVRGLMGAIFSVMVNIGMHYSYTLGLWLSWKWLAVACQVLPVVMLVLMIFTPESPRWLFKMNRYEDCTCVLQWLRGDDANIGPELDELKSNHIPDSGWKEFLKPYVYRPFRIVAILAAFQQFIGMATIPQYMVEIEVAANDHWNPETEAVIVGAVGILANLSSAIFIDHFGRRVVSLIASFILTLSLIGLAVYFTFLNFGNAAAVSEYSYMVFICILIYRMSSSAGLGPMLFVYIAEMLPLNVRGKGTAVSITLMWFFLFVTSFLFPYGVSLIGYYAVFWIFVAISVSSLLFIFFFIPETKGLTLEEIEKMFF